MLLLVLSCSPSTDKVLESRLMEHVKKFVSFGPRTAGSSGSASARAYLSEGLRASGFIVQTESFLASTPQGPVVMSNLIATGPPADGTVFWERRVLAAHYDTKSGMPDRFQGANDGASGCAVLMELAARVGDGSLKTGPLKLIFFDGEEAFVNYTAADGLYGSRDYVRRRLANKTLLKDKELVLVDMVADKDLHFKKDPNSAPGLVARIWEAGRASGLGDILSDDTMGILDDHVPFINAGVPACVLIDLDFGPGNKYWHSAEDRVEHVSGSSMARVLGLLEAYVQAAP